MVAKQAFVLATTASAQTPSQPHLAQAWTALSTGDGLDGQVGQESYYVSSDHKFRAHKYEYPQVGCTKISIHDPENLHHIAGGERNYYLGCDAVNCCYSDFSMKEWDIQKPGMLTSVDFVGFEDTTELNENPVKGAEHWRQFSKLPEHIGIGYEYFVHRDNNSDVISHRIDYNVSGASIGGSILYGDFQVQHDLDAFKNVFTPPAECLKSNVLQCANQQVDTWEQTHFKHDYALRQAAEAAPTQPHLAQAWTAMSTGDGLDGQVGKESYLVTSDRKFRAHMYEYPEAGCTKISLHDPANLHHVTGGERNYYLGCDSVDCCYDDFSMKEWDIQKPGMLTAVDFVGFEDTTELNENPVKGAEHWRQFSKLPEHIGIGYEYFVHRDNNSDVISHRIDYNVSGASIGGSILYGDFQVQHDLDAFKNVFTPPAVCMKSNVLRCAGQQIATWEQKHFKHDHALRQTRSDVIV